MLYNPVTFFSLNLPASKSIFPKEKEKRKPKKGMDNAESQKETE
jgi:hypothetical protein